VRPDTAPRNPFGALTDVPGMRVGHAQRVGDGWLTGCTVVLPPPGSIGGVDVRGGGPATAETDALRPGTLAGRVDGVLLTGGSAFGLPAVAGVQRWCEENRLGFPVGPEPGQVVPIVPAMALFDLGRGGDYGARPDADLAYRAAASATGGPVAGGSVGAGTGALMAGGTLKGGIGTASVRLAGNVVVGALVAVNALGSPVDPATGALFAAAAVRDAAARPTVPGAAEHAAVVSGAGPGDPSPRNTTLVVVATNAAQDASQVTRLAVAAQVGLARALHPVHTLADGDVAVALSTGQADAAAAVETPSPRWPGAQARAGEVAVQAAASTAVTRAVLDAVLAARATTTPAVSVPGYLDLYPSSGPAL
jgi:putative pantetheine hydrolase